MPKIAKILCVIDPTASTQPALQRAAWLAKHTGAELELLICHYNQFLSGDRFFDSRSLKTARTGSIERHRERLEQMASEHRVQGLEISTAVVWDRPLHEGIVRYAFSSGADIVFKDTHRHPGLGLTALSNTDWSLIRTCPTPLWLVKPREIAEQPRLIAAIDPMNEHDKPAELDEEILLMSKSIADAVGGDVDAFHAFNAATATAPKAAGLDIPVYWLPDDLEERMREQHRRRFQELLDHHDIAGDRAHLVTGNTHETLPVLASEIDAALVVMGAVARNRLKRIFIGATAERTLDRLPCDLLVVKSDWFETPVRLDVNSEA